VGELPVNVNVAQTYALLDRPDVLVLDVREPWEYNRGHMPGVTLIPTGEIPYRLGEIPKDRPVIVVCRVGNRSDAVTTYLRERGYANIHNMEGGIEAWQGAGYPVER
jgi:rhodanese-related sulfurtransferase